MERGDNYSVLHFIMERMRPSYLEGSDVGKSYLTWQWNTGIDYWWNLWVSMTLVRAKLAKNWNGYST